MSRRPRRTKRSASDPIAFVRQWRKVLRLPLSAHEARLIDGAKRDAPPSALKDLRARIDKAAIDAALQRRPLSDDPVQRAKFLAGAAAITQDAAVLIDALRDRPNPFRPDLARSFAAAIRQLDLTRTSPARLATLLSLIDESFEPPERLTTAFALLRSERSRSVVGKAVRRLPSEGSASWGPLAAVHESLEGGEPPRDALERGLRLLLDGPPSVLDAQPNQIRFGLVTAALSLNATWPLEHPAIDRILGGLDPDDVAWAGLAFGRAAELVRAGRYDTALAHLDRILEHHPQDLRASVLLSQLAAPRRGSLALPDPSPGALRRGYALRLLKPVWARVDVDPGTIALHRDLTLPGIAPVVLCDVDPRASWFAVDGSLSLLSDAAAALDRIQAIQVASAAVRIAHLLAEHGWTLPDLSPARFLTDATPHRRWVELADLTGLKAQPTVAEAHMRTLAARFVRAALAERPLERGPVRSDLGGAVGERLESLPEHPLALPDLADFLRTLQERS